MRGADRWKTETEAFHRTAMAEMELLARGADVYGDNHPETILLLDYLTQADLQRWISNNIVSRLALSPGDRATAALMLQVKIETSAIPERGDCSVTASVLGFGIPNLSLAVRRRGVVGLVLNGNDGVPSRARLQLMELGMYAGVNTVAWAGAPDPVSEGDAIICLSTST